MKKALAIAILAFSSNAMASELLLDRAAVNSALRNVHCVTTIFEDYNLHIRKPTENGLIQAYTVQYSDDFCYYVVKDSIPGVVNGSGPFDQGIAIVEIESQK